MLVGALLGYFRRTLGLLTVDVLLVAAYLTVTKTPAMGSLDRSWIRQDSVPAGGVTTIVVLSAGVRADSALSSSGADRLLAGLTLLKGTGATRLLTTRDLHRPSPPTITSDLDQRRLVSLAGAVDQWTVLDTVYETHDEGVRAAQFLLPLGVKSIALVTAPLHTRRGCATFERLGFQVTCVAAVSRDFSATAPSDGRERLAAARTYLHERVGMVVYRWRGWIR